MTDKIISFEDVFPRVTIVQHVEHYRNRSDSTLVLGDFDDPVDIKVKAYVNASELAGRGWQGRWIARCPSCPGAEYVDFRYPFFMCCGCFNAKYERKWLKIIVPRNRKKIEELLLKRPHRNRHWLIGETLKQLVQENLDHGIRS